MSDDRSGISFFVAMLLIFLACLTFYRCSGRDPRNAPNTPWNDSRD